MQGIHHVAVFTADYGALAAFYREVFDAEAPAACHEPSVVRAGGAILHVFTTDAVPASFPAAHYHHVALEAADVAHLAVVRERLLARGASDGRVLDFGDHVSVLATDPDGHMVEVLVAKGEPWNPPFAVEPHDA